MNYEFYIPKTTSFTLCWMDLFHRMTVVKFHISIEHNLWVVIHMSKIKLFESGSGAWRKGLIPIGKIYLPVFYAPLASN